MIYLLLIAATVALTLQNVFKQRYHQRSQGGVLLFGAMLSLAAAVFFLAVNRDWQFSVAVLPFSVGFAVSYVVAILFEILAIKTGSLAKTALILSCSLLIPSVYGMVILGEPVSAFSVVGIVLLIVALTLVNYKKSNERVCWKWVLFVILAFIGNGMCSTVQKAEQLKQGAGGSNLFMIVALGLAAVLLLILSLSFREERQMLPQNFRNGWLLALLCGGLNGLVNFLVIYLNPLLPASVLFPVLSGGNMLLVFLWSFLIQKENFHRRQIIGFILGILSVVLLNVSP